jgi:hypothetical protein
MKRVDRLPFAAACVLFAAGDAERFLSALAAGTPLRSIVPMLAAVGWTSIAYHLWRQRTMRVDLGKGRWAELIDADDMTHGIKMKVQALLPGPDNDKHMYLNELVMRDQLIALLVTSWSLELPLPNGDPAALGDVPGSAYDKLNEAAAPHWESLDFLRAGSNSSDSETSSTDTESPDKSPEDEQ